MHDDDRVVGVLIGQGQELVDEMFAFIANGTQPKAHWEEITSWHVRAQQIIETTAPQFLEQTGKFDARSDYTNVIYPALRSTLSILKGLKASSAESDESHPTIDTAHGFWGGVHAALKREAQVRGYFWIVIATGAGLILALVAVL